MAIVSGTCVSFCNQPKAQFGYPRRVTPVCRYPFCGWRHLATSRESKAHFGLPWVRPGTIAVNVRPTWLERGFNAGQTHRSIYSSIFNRLRAIARYWSEIATFSYPPCILRPCLGCSHWNSGKKFGPKKTRIMGLPGSDDSLTIGWAVLRQYQRVTDGQTDGRPAYSYNVCVSLLTHVKNRSQ